MLQSIYLLLTALSFFGALSIAAPGFAADACADPAIELPADNDVAVEALKPKGVAILIPGTFNSLPYGANRVNPFTGKREKTPYFSKDILESFEANGYATYVVRGLRPTAQFEWNGEQTLQEIRAYYERYFAKQNVPITLVGHSAGGIYGLYAATRIDDLPIKNILMISTPMHGVPVADRVANGQMGNWFSWLCDHTQGFFDLRGLVDLTALRVEGFLKNVALKPGVQVFAAAGYQPRGSGFFQASYAEYLSHPMLITSEPEDGPTDGIVPVESSYGARAEIHDRNGGRVEIQRLTSLAVKLDHMEQILDYRLLAVIGTQHRSLVAEEQRRSYGALAAYAMAH